MRLRGWIILAVLLGTFGACMAAMTLGETDDHMDVNRTPDPSAGPFVDMPAWPPQRSAPQAEPPPAVSLPDTGVPDRSDPAAVGAAVLTAWFSYDTRIDANRTAGEARAADTGLLTAELAEQVRNPAGADVKPTGDWAAWTEAGAVVAAAPTEVPNQGMANTDQSYHAMFQVNQTANGSASTVLAPIAPLVVAVALTNDGDGWSVATVNVL